MMTLRARSHFPWFSRCRPPILAAAALLLLILAPSVLRAGEGERIAAALLTRDLGDPRAPGNLKLVLTLPDSLARYASTAKAGDFHIYVYPAELSEAEGTSDEFRAGGVYLWRRGAKIFLDARVLPAQDREGSAAVKVVFAPDGVPLAEGLAEGMSRYASDLVDVVLAVDVSRSMLYNDPQKRRVTAARTFMEMAEQGGGIGRVGLVTFNHRANVNTQPLPLEQGETVLKALAKVGAEGLTNLDTPLKLGMSELRKVDSKRPVIILLTDGKNEGSVYKNTHLKCAEAGVRLFTVGLTEAADHELLKEMADVTGGIYFRAPKDSDLPEIYARLAAELGKRQLLHAQMLRSANGAIDIPVDASVKRLVAMADGGARVGVRGPGGARLFAGEALSGVQMGRPVPGSWQLTWSDAAPDLSLLALFGDTQFFLDVFPPQLRGDKLAVGATLARGARPLPGASVWMEAIPGLIDEQVELFDDGLHGDGEAGDGVYGAVIDYYGDENRFDVILRASGQAWDDGRFVRQSSGLTIRTPGPATDDVAKIGGDIDFGVLFPGETGTALARVSLEAPSVRELFFDLSWDAESGDWPDFSSRVSVEPGERSFSIEMTVPEAAPPGEYLGRFSVSDGRHLGDVAASRVKVGTVRFPRSGVVDLGVVPPGTFASRTLSLEYDADKEAPVEVTVSGGEGDLTLTAQLSTLPAGRGKLPVEAMVSVPIGKTDGEYEGSMIVRAGPGRAEIPLRWRVKAYASAPAASIKPIEGLPTPPRLGVEPTLPGDGDADASRTLPKRGGETWRPDGPKADAVTLDSPWERTSDLLRKRLRDADLGPDGKAPGGSEGFRFPTIETSKEDGDGFWSAWWIYLLAALLLILLLLLLLAYILYRLGKSALARFLLVSALANLILLAIFIALLGASLTEGYRARPTIAVNLVDDEPIATVDLSPAEQAMIEAAGRVSDSAGASGSSAAREITFADAQASAAGGELLEERNVPLPEGVESGLELAEVRQPSAAPLESRRRDNLSRRDRLPERSNLSQPAMELPEMAEPPVEAGAPTGGMPQVGEAQLEMESPVEAERAIWSEGRRPVQPAASDQGMLLAESPGVEAVSLDARVRRVDPRGRRRSVNDMSDAYPEPRVDISDPVRDVVETSAQTSENDPQAEPGIKEIRVEARAMGSEDDGRKPGASLPPGAARLEAEPLETLARGTPAEERVELALARGGRRMSRGGATPAGSNRPLPEGEAPGSLNRGSADAPDAASGGRPGKTSGGAVGEKRFDAMNGGPEGGDGLPDSRGVSRVPGKDATGGEPSSLRGKRGSERSEFSPRKGTNGRNGGPDAQRRGERGNGAAPDGPERVPGGGDSTASRPGKPDADDGPGGRSGKPGVGEGRFDEMERGAGPGGRERRDRADGFGGLGDSVLDGVGDRGGMGIVPFDSTPGDWRRNDRRTRQRTVSVASSSVDENSLLIVVGDFARLPDPAAENLFGVLAKRLTGGMEVEERRLSPDDRNLSDCLLAVMTPEEAARWPDADVGKLADYLRSGGHLWLDAQNREQAAGFMKRLATASGGSYGPLDPGHPLADAETVDALTMNDKLAAVVTYQDWRRNWRYGDARNGRTFRFLIRTLNYFLSGDADAGIVLRDEKSSDELFVEPSGDRIPDLLAGEAKPSGTLWDDFGPVTAPSWSMPSWSDPGRISAASDGEGGRALKMDLRGAVKGRAAAYRTLTPPQDFSRTNRITLDVYYDGQGDAAVSMVFTVQGPQGWADYESAPRKLSTGWNPVEFVLRGEDMRALAGEGGLVNGLPGAGRVGRAGFFLYRSGDSAAVAMFRNIRLHEE